MAWPLESSVLMERHSVDSDQWPLAHRPTVVLHVTFSGTQFEALNLRGDLGMEVWVGWLPLLLLLQMGTRAHSCSFNGKWTWPLET